MWTLARKLRVHDRVRFDDAPRARVDTRVLEVIARLDGPPGVALPLGLRTRVYLAR